MIALIPAAYAGPSLILVRGTFRRFESILQTFRCNTTSVAASHMLPHFSVKSATHEPTPFLERTTTLFGVRPTSAPLSFVDYTLWLPLPAIKRNSHQRIAGNYFRNDGSLLYRYLLLFFLILPLNTYLFYTPSCMISYPV